MVIRRCKIGEYGWWGNMSYWKFVHNKVVNVAVWGRALSCIRTNPSDSDPCLFSLIAYQRFFCLVDHIQSWSPLDSPKNGSKNLEKWGRALSCIRTKPSDSDSCLFTLIAYQRLFCLVDYIQSWSPLDSPKTRYQKFRESCLRTAVL